MPDVKTKTLFLFVVLLMEAAASGGSPQDYQGITEPVRAVVIRAEASGQVLTERMAKEGASLARGEVLAEQDTREQAGVVALAKLQAEDELSIRRAQETVKELELRYEQAKTLLSRDAGAEWELRQARVQLELAKIDEAIARQEQDAAALRQEVEAARLARFTLRAPFDGRIMKFEAVGGATLAAGDPVAVFADLTRLKVEVYLPVERYGAMKVGTTYRLQAESPVNEQLDAELAWIDPMIDSASQTFRCVFQIDNADMRFPSGFRVWLPDQDDADNLSVESTGPGRE
ncbi:MAG: efflux RND transporter periplasmic adaptor subunit [Planctomycetota bacterium]